MEMVSNPSSIAIANRFSNYLKVPTKYAPPRLPSASDCLCSTAKCNRKINKDTLWMLKLAKPTKSWQHLIEL